MQGRRVRAGTAKHTFANLPGDVIWEIFFLIGPTAARARCRRVCKTWFKLLDGVINWIDLATEYYCVIPKDVRPRRTVGYFLRGFIRRVTLLIPSFKAGESSIAQLF